MDFYSACLAAVGRGVETVSGTFREQPASFLYESDVQGLLYAHLFHELRGQALRYIPTDTRWLCGGGPREISLNPVKTEYPSRLCFDIAILDGDLKWTDRTWTREVLIGIEIKLWQVDGTGYWFNRDRAKLEDYANGVRSGKAFTGLSLVFCHDANDSRVVEAKKDGVDFGSGPRVPPRNGVAVWGVTGAP